MQTVLPSAETAAMLFWALLASGQTTMRKVDEWQTLAEKPSIQCIDLAAWRDNVSPLETTATSISTNSATRRFAEPHAYTFKINMLPNYLDTIAIGIEEACMTEGYAARCWKPSLSANVTAI
jgi:Flp pilus assembly protein TadG